MSSFSNRNPYAQVETMHTALYAHTGENAKAVQDEETLNISVVNVTNPLYMQAINVMPCPCPRAYSAIPLAYSSAKTNTGTIKVVPNPLYSDPFSDMNWVTNEVIQMKPQNM